MKIDTPMQTKSEQANAWTPDLQAWLDDCARATGFDAAGIADVPEANSAEAEREQGDFAAWLEAGRAGEMEYLKRRDEQGTLLRGTLQAAMPWARSVIVCALSYNADAPRSIDSAPSGAGWIARYAWSGRTLEDNSQAPTDYHDELLSRLREIEAELHLRADCTTRCYVDTGPLLERNLAAKAGVGWIGKNTCVLNQKLGSWLLLGVIVTSLPLKTKAAIVAASDRCGTCTRCIDACPTNALLGSISPNAPRTMDASLCIAYLTIEKKGMIDESLRAPMGRNVFGCDICQDVCPWNRKAPIVAHPGMEPRPELVNPALEWLAGLDAAGFKRVFKGSPLERTGRTRLLRNVAIAMGNSGTPEFLPQLDEWANATEAQPASRHSEALREAASWARERILEKR